MVGAYLLNLDDLALNERIGLLPSTPQRLSSMAFLQLSVSTFRRLLNDYTFENVQQAAEGCAVQETLDGLACAPQLCPQYLTVYNTQYHLLRGNLCFAGEAPEVSERDAIRAAVERRIDSLDEFFVASLRLFGQAAREQSNHNVAGAYPAHSSSGFTQNHMVHQVTQYPHM